MALKSRQLYILMALKELGGEATTLQIAELAKLNVNGVSQSLGALSEHVKRLNGRGGETKWQIINLPKPELVRHHDDPPCTARLENGRCPKCKLHPDTQSTCFYFYCRTCHAPLNKNMRCPLCTQKYQNPNS